MEIISFKRSSFENSQFLNPYDDGKNVAFENRPVTVSKQDALSAYTIN